MTVETPPSASTTEASFPIAGLTCASCVRRVEKALGRVEGVHEASVNLPTEKATVVFDPGVASVERMRAAVEKAGYAIGEPPAERLAMPTTSQSVEAAAPADDAHDVERQREVDDLR